MLDAYIIERIRREREAEKNEGNLVPLRIEVPRGTPPENEEKEPEPADRGSIIIDFNL
jgi:hypothetical protein